MHLSDASVQHASSAHTSVVECSPQPVRNRKSSGIKVPRKTLSGPYLHTQPRCELRCACVQGQQAVDLAQAAPEHELAGGSVTPGSASLPAASQPACQAPVAVPFPQMDTKAVQSRWHGGRAYSSSLF